MILVTKYLAGFIKFRKCYFPTERDAASVADRLASNEIVRLLYTNAELPDHPHLVKRTEVKTSCLDLTTGVDALYQQMDKKSCRYEIRRAEKMEDRLRISVNTQETVADFFRLYNDFARAKGGPPHLSKRNLAEFTSYSDVYVAYLEERAICSHLILKDQECGRVRLLFSATTKYSMPEDARVTGAVNRYLHWHEIRHYIDENYKIFDFGGVRGPGHAVSRFKLSFGGQVKSEYCYTLAGAPRLVRLGMTLSGRYREEGKSSAELAQSGAASAM